MQSSAHGNEELDLNDKWKNSLNEIDTVEKLIDLTEDIIASKERDLESCGKRDKEKERLLRIEKDTELEMLDILTDYHEKCCERFRNLSDVVGKKRPSELKYIEDALEE